MRVVRWVLARRADPNIAHNSGVTPAMVASLNGHLEVVQLLAIHSADVEATCNYTDGPPGAVPNPPW